MLPGGSRSKGTIAWLVASCVLSARWMLVAAFLAVFVFSSPLSSYPFKAAHSSRKAAPTSTTKAKAISITAERLSSSRRVAHSRVTNRPSLPSIASPSRGDDPQPIVRPLRC